MNYKQKMFKWLPQNSELEPFYNGICEFIDKYVVLEQVKYSYKSKDLLDPCVGYVKLNGWEITIIDTPLFQRLRRITQLGLAYLVYPTLRYSRFEHTIGVLGRLNQVLQRLKEKHESDSDLIKIEDILKKYETQIRLAAIFHDCGHCIFSHLSEDVIERLPGINGIYPSTKKIKDIFNNEFASGDANLSITEIFSICFLGSTKIAEILIKSNIKLNLYKDKKLPTKPHDLSEYLLQTARFIAGLPIEDDARTVFLAQLVNSGLDVDKLDYMSREEWFSGIKIDMDLQRIMNKLKLFHYDTHTDLPKELVKYSKHINDSKNANKNYIVLGIEKGGQFSYEEFCVARLALYEKIYLHKKVRAAESLYKQKLEFLCDLKDDFKKAHYWLFLKESISELKYTKIIADKTGLQNTFFQDIGIPKETEIKFDFLDIEERNIPYRTFGFGPANSKTDINLKENIGDIDQNHLQLSSVRFWNYLNPNQKFRPTEKCEIESFKEEIIEEAYLIITALKNLKNSIEETDHILEIFNNKTEIEIKNKLKEYTIIDVPDYRRVQLKYGSLNFEEATYQTVKWTLPIDQIAKYYQLHRILAYVYTELDYCPIILLACERAVYKKNNFDDTPLVFDQTQSVSNHTLEQANRIKNLLLKESPLFYKDFGDIHPVNPDLQTVSAKDKIQNIVEKLKKLTCLEEDISYLKVEKFLSQFDSHLIIPALNLISNIQVLSNSEIRDEIKEVINSVPENNDKLGILPLGNYMSSSSNMMKSYSKELNHGRITQLDLSNPQKICEVGRLFFVDDNINTGIQALNIIAKMLNRADRLDEKLKIDEIHNIGGEAGMIKDENVISHIKDIPITFIFITGYKDSASNLKNYLKEYCDFKDENLNIIIKYILEDEYKIFSGSSYPKEDVNNVFYKVRNQYIQEGTSILDLKSFLEKVGQDVVKERSIISKYAHEPSKHALGYYNRESLVIFPNSVPTMTLTALWCNGTYGHENKKWAALIPRTKKNN